MAKTPRQFEEHTRDCKVVPRLSGCDGTPAQLHEQGPEDSSRNVLDTYIRTFTTRSADEDQCL